MMTHLHVKSTEPKAAPQPVSTELHQGKRHVFLRCFPAPKQRRQENLLWQPVVLKDARQWSVPGDLL